MHLLLPGCDQAAGTLSAGGGRDAAEAIRTTDSRAKTASIRHADGWSVGGMAKGAGMLAPSLATMLCVLTTDAVVESGRLDHALRAGTRRSFDRIDSDGCMSTNDTVVLMASGASGVSPDLGEFDAAVAEICTDLASQLLSDAEGASKEVEILVTGAASEDDAVEVGRAVARNNLLKCALYGNDPNWGRILAAVGTTKAVFEPDRIDVAINGVQVCRDGAAGEDRDAVDLSERSVLIAIELHAGTKHAAVFTNDLSHDYVEENSAYSS